jgi:hypothetical protein
MVNTAQVLAATEVLAANNFGNTRSGGLAGPMGLFLIVVLSVATVLLIRNMNSRLRRLPERFGEPQPAEGADRVESVGAGPAAERIGKESTGSVPSGPEQQRKA